MEELEFDTKIPDEGEETFEGEEYDEVQISVSPSSTMDFR